LLLLLLGPATRLSEYFLEMDKEYEATVHFGIETTTHDPEGDVVFQTSAWRELNRPRLETALRNFRGEISQKPPAYSAKKIRGEASHRRIRRGENVELEPVQVNVEELSVLDTEWPRVRLAVRCSSGTYVRALARDLGRVLEVGGHLSALRRTRIGPFHVSSAVSPEALNDVASIMDHLIPPGTALDHFPTFEVGEGEAARVRQGQSLAVPATEIPEGEPVRILLGGELVAVASREGGELRPRKVFTHG
jgi:tRNA pseudouridine55 synthase